MTSGVAGDRPFTAPGFEDGLPGLPLPPPWRRTGRLFFSAALRLEDTRLSPLHDREAAFEGRLDLALCVLALAAAQHARQIKHVRSKAAASPTGRARFWREARVLATLEHPAIVRIFDVLEDESGDWIVMELVEGMTLAELLRESPPDEGLGLVVSLDYGRQIADGLAAAHERGIVHRDLKTENVMVCRTSAGRTSASHLKILDFGLAPGRGRSGPALCWRWPSLRSPRTEA